MRGKVKKYNSHTGHGTIRGVDGHQYPFEGNDGEVYQANQRVKFRVVDGRAEITEAKPVTVYDMLSPEERRILHALIGG